MEILNTLQLHNILANNTGTKSKFIGVYAKDEFEKLVITKFPSCIILNTDVSSKSGEHWLALYFVNQNTVEFFDSYGNKPSYFKLNLNFKHIKYNTKQIQGYNSAICGYYACLFLLFRCNRYSFDQYVNFYSFNTLKNDQLILHLIKHFK